MNSIGKIKLWIAVFALIAAGAYGASRYACGSMTFLFYRMAFNYLLACESKELDEQARSGLSSTYYFTSYYLHGMISAAEGTGSDRIMRRVIGIIDTMISTAQEIEIRGTAYYAWRPFSITADSAVPMPNLHYTFQATVPIARAAAVIRANPRWRKKYEKAARRYVAFADQTIIRYWYHEQLKDRIPWIDPEHFPIWNDNGSNFGLIAVFLYRTTHDPLYRDLSQRIALAFRNKLSPYGSGWIWENQSILIGSDKDNTPGSVGNQAGVPDTSHANREAFLVMSFHEAGIVFTRADVMRMADIVNYTLWNGSADDPGFANYVNGSNKPYRVYKQPGLNGSIYHGWALMGGYSEKTQRIMLYTLNAILRKKNNPSLERNTTSYGGKLALCGHILRNFALLSARGRAGAPVFSSQ